MYMYRCSAIYSGELRTGTTHARAIIGGHGQRQWYSRPRGPLTNSKAEYVDYMWNRAYKTPIKRIKEGFKLRCFSGLLDQPPAWSRDPATPIPVQSIGNLVGWLDRRTKKPLMPRLTFSTVCLYLHEVICPLAFLKNLTRQPWGKLL